jgi:hypothetical protein
MPSLRLLSSALSRFVLAAASLLLVVTLVLWAAACTAQSGGVRGRVLDDSGRPVAGARMGVYYRSFEGGQRLYGGSYNRQTTTGPDGRYSFSLSGMPRGEYVVSGTFEGIDLIPENPATFASTVATVRNFAHRLVETTDDNDYGNGAILAVDTAIGDYTDLAGLELTLRSRDTGRTYTRTVRRTGEGYAVTGLPFGAFDVSGRMGGRAVGIRPYDGDGPFSSSLILSVRQGAVPPVMRAQIRP